MAKTRTKSNNKKFPFPHLPIFHFSFLKLSRETLYHRHRLSHQQIDQLLGEQKSGQYLPEKLAQMEQLGEFFRVTDALKEARIEFICLKGPLLSQRIYNDLSYRHIGDFDFLLDFDQISKGISALRKIGFEPLNHQWPSDTENLKFIKKTRNQYQLFSNSKNILVELHWDLLPHPPVKPEIIKQLVKCYHTQTSAGGRVFNVLKPELELAFLIIHGGMHRWKRLKWLIDIKDYPKKKLLDNKLFKETISKLKAHKMVGLCNLILGKYFSRHIPLPFSFKPPKFLVSQTIQKIESSSDKEHESVLEMVSYFFFLFFAFPGLKYKSRLILFVWNSFLDTGAEKLSVKTFLKSPLKSWKYLRKLYGLKNI